MSANNNSSKGSEWRKWDLQIQPIKNEFLSNCEKNNKRINLSIDKFVKKAIEKNISVIAITDHNTGYAIDLSLQYVNEKSLDITILPSVELDSNSGEHIIIIFNEDYKDKLKLTTWKEVIDSFLQTCCNIHPPFFDENNVPKKINKTTEDLIKIINNEDVGIVIFAHCLSNDGFFQRCGDANRRKEICEKFLNGEYRFIFEIKEYNQKNEVFDKLKSWFGEKNANLFPIISSSDAHAVNDIGKYFTWIKADPTFEGLKQIIYEPEERVCIGEEPEIIKRVKENKTKFINSVKINQLENYNESKGVWFKNIEIPLNSGFVAIIGNKGNGKSALADIIALCGNSHLYSDFSFLKDDKFLKDGLASNFESELFWEGGDPIKKKLNEKTDKNSPERVRYIPQNFFERLTNNLETYDFEKTLEEVIFSHIPDEERLNKNSFSELIEYKKQLSDKDINTIRTKISELNEKIINIEKKLHPDYKKQLEEKLKLKQKELEEHNKIKPDELPDPSQDEKISEELKANQNTLQSLNEELAKTENEINETQNKLKEISLNIEELEIINKDLEGFKSQLEEYIENNKERFSNYGLEISEIIKYEINDNSIKQKIEEQEKKQQELKNKLLTEEEINNLKDLSKDQKSSLINNSFKIKQKKLKEKIENIKGQLSEPQKKYQRYLEELKKWKIKKSEIEGDKNTPDTIKWFEKEIKYIKAQIRRDLTDLRNKRLELSLQINNKKKDIISIYRSFKDAVDKKIQQFQNILGEYEINIEASLKIKSDFYDEFLKFINQKVKGSFYGIDDGKFMLKKLVKNKNINTNEDIKSLLTEMIEYLEKDKRDNFNNEHRNIKDQILNLEKWNSFYDYIFSLDYIEPIYELKLGNKNLIQLSPGERGALLIVFYLMLDKENIPLIIDQPEENLDNESVYRILTHFIRFVKKQRQIIIVTHNPNLAIVGDAEQIIYVKIDKKGNNKFNFESGSIENPIINKHSSDILEGTIKAFDIRRLKYFNSI